MEAELGVQSRVDRQGREWRRLFRARTNWIGLAHGREGTYTLRLKAANGGAWRDSDSTTVLGAGRWPEMLVWHGHVSVQLGSSRSLCLFQYFSSGFCAIFLLTW
jgi:hypothetical protein